MESYTNKDITWAQIGKRQSRLLYFEKISIKHRPALAVTSRPVLPLSVSMTFRASDEQSRGRSNCSWKFLISALMFVIAFPVPYLTKKHLFWLDGRNLHMKNATRTTGVNTIKIYSIDHQA